MIETILFVVLWGVLMWWIILLQKTENDAGAVLREINKTKELLWKLWR